MPEAPNPKLREAPPPNLTRVAFSSHAYAELDVKTNFTFLCGASHPDELVYRAAELGYRAIGVAEINSLAGVVRMHEAAKEVGLPLLVGSRLVFTDAPDLLVWASDRASYAALCRLLTLGKRRAEKGHCTLHLQDFLNDNQGLHAAIVTPANVASLREPMQDLTHNVNIPSPGTPGEGQGEGLLRCQIASTSEMPLTPTLSRSTGRGGSSIAFPRATALRQPTAIEALRDALGDRLSLAVSCSYGPDDAARLAAVAQLSDRFGVTMLATNAVHYHDPSRRALQDVLTCVKHGCTIGQAGFRLFPNGERYLKSPEQMHRLFADYPQALRRGLQIADACQFQLDSLRYEYPDELAPRGMSSLQYLKELTETGLGERYPQGIHPRVRAQIEHELKLIEQLKFEAYFLTVHDLVRFARSRGILCQGRGSAANSAVCYAIGVTSVDPARVDLLFERFISAARNEPPDIDIDFEHERREEVIQYIYTKYGRERAGMTAEVITYRGRSAVRDVGKAMGLSLDMVDSMAAKLDWWDRGLLTDEQIRACGLDPDDANVRRVITLATDLLGFPRHLSQHVGGLVMTRGPLCEIVPIENASMEDRTVIEWDKDDIDSLGILKVDALALGMLTAISRAFGLINDYQKAPSASRFEQIQALSMPAEEVSPSSDIPLSPSPGTPGEGRGEGLALPSDGTEDPHPNPLPAYRERGQAERWAVPTLHEGADPSRVGTAHHLPSHDERGQAERWAVPTLREGADPRGVGDEPAHCSSTPDPVGPDSERSEIRTHRVRRGREDLGTWSADKQFHGLVPHHLPLSLHTIPPADPRVYDMICDADTVGVFQIESRAQMSMLPRLRPRCFYDLVIEVAIVRPGPIQGNMVHPYLRRRSGDEPVSFPSEELRHVLEKTLGVPLFQEQAMRIAMVAAGFTADEADKLRRVMAAWRRSGAIETFHRKIVEGMVGNGYTREFAEQCFNQIKGFGEYGFPESHAASFALLVYVSAWIKRHHPAAFAAALINSQPMGFYMPAQIVRDAQDHGVHVLPVDVNESDWDCTLERGEGLRAEEINGGRCPPCVDASAARAEETNSDQCPSYIGEFFGRVPRLGTASRGRYEQSNGSPSSDQTVAPSACRVGTAHHLSASSSPPKSEWGTHGPQLRLGLRQLKGFKETYARQIENERKRSGRFTSIEQLQQRAHLPTSALRILAEADAFGSLGLSRRQALWQVMELKDVATPLFDREVDGPILNADLFRAATVRERGTSSATGFSKPPLPNGRGSDQSQSMLFSQPPSPDPVLPTMPLGQEVMTDYATAGLSLKKHPVALIRDQLRARRIVTSKELNDLPDGRWVKVAGLVLMRQRPGTASGIVFETLEDETGIVNLIVKPDIYDRYRPAARHAGLLEADGYLQRQGDVIHVIPKRMIDLSDMIAGYELRSRDFH